MYATLTIIDAGPWPTYESGPGYSKQALLYVLLPSAGHGEVRDPPRRAPRCPAAVPAWQLIACWAYVMAGEDGKAARTRHTRAVFLGAVREGAAEGEQARSGLLDASISKGSVDVGGSGLIFIRPRWTRYNVI